MKSLRVIGILAHATFLEAIRNKILWALVILALILSLFNIIFTTLFTWDLGKVAIEFGLSAVAFVGLLLVFFLGIKILADDFERKQIHMVLARPVTGWQYIVGKFAGLAVTLLLSSVIMGICNAISMQYTIMNYAEFIPVNFSWLTYLMSMICQLFSLLIILSFSMLCYCFASNSFVSVLFAVLLYFISQNMAILRQVVIENPYAGVVAGHEGIYVVVSWIFPNLSYFDKKMEAAYGLPFSGFEFMLITLYGIAYIILMLFLSTLIFNRKEFS